MNWNAIETAPLNEEAVLLFIPGGTYRSPVITSAFWITYNVEGWHVSDQKNEPYPLRGPSPTHWMALPEPPEAA